MDYIIQMIQEVSEANRYEEDDSLFIGMRIFFKKRRVPPEE